MAILGLAAALNSILPQGEIAGLMPANQVSQIPRWQLMLGGAGITAMLYGLLGFIGLTLWRNLGFPDIWNKRVTNRQRFLIPAIFGAALGVALIIGDLMFSPTMALGG